MLQGRAKNYAIAQAVISSLGCLTSLAGGGVMLAIGFFSSLLDPSSAAEAGVLLVLGWTSLLVGVAFVPGLITVIYAWKGKLLPVIKPAWQHSLMIFGVIVWLSSLLFVGFTSHNQVFNFITSLLILPLVLVPILFFFWVGARKLSLGNQLRAWGAVAFNFSLTMPIVLAAEMVVFFVIFIFITFWLLGQPELLTQIMQFGEQASNGMINPVDAEQFIVQLLSNPAVLTGSILVVSVLVPLIEELLKPMAIWFLAGKRLTPSQGFVGGLIGGACFAILESLGAVGIPADSQWLVLLFARTGTGILHVALSGMVGWGLASAFYEGKWLRAFLTYLLAVGIHGLWNFFALLSGLVPILPISEQMDVMPIILGQLGVFVLLLLFVVNFILLFSLNHHLQRENRLPVNRFS